jgi:hypothetical protein
MRRQRTTPIDISNIVKESQKRIKKALVEGFEYHHLAIAKSDHFLRKHASQRLDLAVIYVDLVGSTRMSTELFTRSVVYYRTFWRVCAKICRRCIHWLLSL